MYFLISIEIYSVLVFRELSTNRILQPKLQRNESTRAVEREGALSQAKYTEGHMTEERNDSTKGVKDLHCH